MNALRSVAATLALFSSFFALGCLDSESVDELEEPGAAPLVTPGGNTSGGDNGASQIEFWAAELQIIQATQRPLFDPGTTNVDATTDTALDSGVIPPKLFAYAVKCGLEEGSGVAWGDTVFKGKGHLSTTGAWKTSALSYLATNELLTCMVGLLNPLGITVPIAFSGPSVAEDGADHSEFNVEEALWQVSGTGPTKIYKAWPMRPFKVRCATDPFDALEERVCGQNPVGCALQQGSWSECAFVPNKGYYCNGKPAILTTLRESDVEVLHPSCAPDSGDPPAGTPQ